jgi:HSP20 family protein
MTVATLVRWEPIRELATLQTEMSRLMNGLFEGNGRAAQEWVPAVDVWEQEDELVYAFDLPGVPEDKIAVELHDDTLTITAERERTATQAEEGFRRFERRFGSFTKPAAPKARRIKLGGGHPTLEGSSEPGAESAS